MYLVNSYCMTFGTYLQDGLISEISWTACSVQEPEVAESPTVDSKQLEYGLGTKLLLRGCRRGYRGSLVNDYYSRL